MGLIYEKVCVVLGLALFPEKWTADGIGAANQWLFLDGVTDSRSTLERQNKETEQGKTAYASFLKRNVFTNSRFVLETASGKLGTHSIKKFATTFCRAGGSSKDDTNYRAQWKAQR